MTHLRLNPADFFERSADMVAYAPVNLNRVFNVVHYGAVGNGIADDTVAINAAVAAAGVSGGIVLFPRGHYIYNGAGIVNNPGATTVAPIRLVGAGPLLSRITFNAVTNAECIRLSHQQSMGTGYDYGQGISGLYISAPVSKDIIKIENLEHWIIDDIATYGGLRAFVIDESRMGFMYRVQARQYTETGLKIYGDDHCINNFMDCLFLNEAVGVDWGIDYTLAGGSAQSTGAYFVRCGVNGANGGGWKFASGSAAPIWVFLNHCISDGVFEDAAWLFSKVSKIVMDGVWGVNHTNNLAAFKYDDCSEIIQMGGQAYGGGTGGRDFEFLNSCDRITIKGTRCDGGKTALYTDATNHTHMDINIPPLPSGAVWSNDPTRFKNETDLLPTMTAFSMPNGFIEGWEIADVAVPAANKGRLYWRDNGAGKTQLVAVFNTGAVQVIATQP